MMALVEFLQHLTTTAVMAGGCKSWHRRHRDVEPWELYVYGRREDYELGPLEPSIHVWTPLNRYCVLSSSIPRDYLEHLGRVAR